MLTNSKFLFYYIMLSNFQAETQSCVIGIITVTYKYKKGVNAAIWTNIVYNNRTKETLMIKLIFDFAWLFWIKIKSINLYECLTGRFWSLPYAQIHYKSFRTKKIFLNTKMKNLLCQWTNEIT